MRIPAFLYPLHGRNPSAAAVLLAWGAGLLAAAAILLFDASRGLSFSLLQWILAGLLAFDSSAGIAACLSRQTSAFYSARPDLRWAFISLHFVQPLVVLLAFNAGTACFVFLWIYPLASAAVLNLLRRNALGRPLAGLLYAAGVIVLTLSVRVPLGLEWFGYLFLAKLILCFNSHE